VKIKIKITLLSEKKKSTWKKIKANNSKTRTKNRKNKKKKICGTLILKIRSTLIMKMSAKARMKMKSKKKATEFCMKPTLILTMQTMKRPKITNPSTTISTKIIKIAKLKNTVLNHSHPTFKITLNFLKITPILHSKMHLINSTKIYRKITLFFFFNNSPTHKTSTNIFLITPTPTNNHLPSFMISILNLMPFWKKKCHLIIIL
jgi:hypothetical protein